METKNNLLNPITIKLFKVITLSEFVSGGQPAAIKSLLFSRVKQADYVGGFDYAIHTSPIF